MEHNVQDRMAQATIFPDVQEASDLILNGTQVPQQSIPVVHNSGRGPAGNNDILVLVVEPMLKAMIVLVAIAKIAEIIGNYYY